MRKNGNKENADVLKPFLALICTGTTCSQASVCSSTIWRGKGQLTEVEQRSSSSEVGHAQVDEAAPSFVSSNLKAAWRI